ncbi:nuclear transport factor 2 family protein [Lacinutrix neustonica]|uniref:Nuclear transport factor 2 family protein n=1 Tax=Lacinutrix neustonica TaxID=2980107 RepID=A0A9E8MYK9_9FLAO|nr:nuclear transport factor 2 family protein [Lacinutrix neustonica]WAC02639.1 nuclear transport factor 2 family protein [Lacinutrix neustonica]
MNYYLGLLLFICFGSISAQTDIETEVKQTITTFFEGFHKQDSTIIKSVIYKDVILQSIGKNRAGIIQLETQDFPKFLKSIVAIPKDQSFEEKLLRYHIQVDGNMANAWTDYTFWFNGVFSHCGVNSFQLIKENDQWKIFYLVDTRRREDCDN